MSGAELVLAAMFAANLALGALERRAAAKERQRLLSAALARTPQEFVALEQAAAPTPRRRKGTDPEPAMPIGL